MVIGRFFKRSFSSKSSDSGSLYFFPVDNISPFGIRGRMENIESRLPSVLSCLVLSDSSKNNEVGKGNPNMPDFRHMIVCLVGLLTPAIFDSRMTDDPLASIT